jgi:hypothetical protein
MRVRVLFLTALNSRRAVLKDLGARKTEEAMQAQLLGERERERKGSGGAGSLPSCGGDEGGGGRGMVRPLTVGVFMAPILGIRSIYSSPGPKTTTILRWSK